LFSSFLGLLLSLSSAGFWAAVVGFCSWSGGVIALHPADKMYRAGGKVASMIQVAKLSPTPATALTQPALPDASLSAFSLQTLHLRTADPLLLNDTSR
jgi:hypothetical protein